jgi:AraC-like DNA-binding protein
MALMLPIAPNNELSQLIAKYSKGDGENETSIPGVTFFKASSVEEPLPSVYEPCLCIIAQGYKEVMLNDEVYRYAPSQYLMVGVDLPIMNRILAATLDEPYLLMKIAINLQQVSELIVRSRIAFSNLKPERALFVGHLDERMADSALRLARLLETPQDIPILAEHTLGEVFYYVLKSDNGGLFAQAALNGSNTQRIARAIQKIRSDYRTALSVDELAKTVGMSVSSFHAHFKSVTAMSPLQFQKKLRLIEARNLMVSNGSDAATAAYAVGYESASQFSREYARMYGNPPRRDMTLLKSRF